MSRFLPFLLLPFSFESRMVHEDSQSQPHGTAPPTPRKSILVDPLKPITLISWILETSLEKAVEDFTDEDSPVFWENLVGRNMSPPPPPTNSGYYIT